MVKETRSLSLLCMLRVELVPSHERFAASHMLKVTTSAPTAPCDQTSRGTSRFAGDPVTRTRQIEEGTPVRRSYTPLASLDTCLGQMPLVFAMLDALPLLFDTILTMYT